MQSHPLATDLAATGAAGSKQRYEWELAFIKGLAAVLEVAPARVGVEEIRAGSITVTRSNISASNNIGQETIGHLKAKPFVVLHRLAALPPGAMLVYSDVNVFKHPVTIAANPPTQLNRAIPLI